MTQLIPNWQPELLENSTVKLVPLTNNDFEPLYAIASDPAIWQQHPSKDRYKREIFQQYFDSAIFSNSAFLILDKLTNAAIGSTRYYDFKPEFPSIAIGYTFLAVKYWGGPYNKASKTLLLNYAFQFVDKVYFHIEAKNIRSQRALHKLGSKKVNNVNFDLEGRTLLHFEYVIQKQDWENNNL